ncbi:MBL fold metallo-hydrolase [Candidatus Woesearchaeota archaeon]|nr:MBL fold metallo-hydrolase [Candidatus Woesearchaeota archaeon]
MNVRWLGNYSFVLEIAGKVIVVDPQAGSEDDYPIADIIIVTQFHVAHCNVGLVRKCLGPNTALLGTSEVASQIYPCSLFEAGDNRIFDDVEIFCTPVHNDRPPLRPEQAVSERIGFVIHYKDSSYFFIGDSDFVEGMQDILPSVLFIPVGGTVVPDAEQASAIARVISPKVAIPVHWGDFVGTKDDADYFADLCREKNINVLVPVKGEVFTI